MVRNIVSNPDFCSGAPRIEGTRLTCANVVLTLTLGEMDVDEYLKVYPQLRPADIKECATYCASQRCIDDKVATFCQGCSLDSRVSEPCEYANPIPDAVDIGFDESSEDDAVNVWEFADELVGRLDNFGGHANS